MYNVAEEYYSQLHHMSIFYGVEKSELKTMLTCIGAYKRKYKKDEYIYLCEDDVEAVGIILYGKVHMIREDLWGNKTLIVSMESEELFGETFCCGINKNSTVSFLSMADTEVMFLPFNRVINSCTMSCKFHHRLIENMVKMIAVKNTALIDKVDIISKKTLREKIFTFLLQEAGKRNSSYFDIQLGRVQLAEYLCADRSALTRELSMMRDEGIIDYDKNSFHILKNIE